MCTDMICVRTARHLTAVVTQVSVAHAGVRTDMTQHWFVACLSVCLYFCTLVNEMILYMSQKTVMWLMKVTVTSCHMAWNVTVSWLAPPTCAVLWFLTGNIALTPCYAWLFLNEACCCSKASTYYADIIYLHHFERKRINEHSHMVLSDYNLLLAC